MKGIYSNNLIYSKAGIESNVDYVSEPFVPPPAIDAGTGYIKFGKRNYLFFDVQNSIINKLEFTHDTYGSKDAKLILNNLPDFHIELGMSFEIVYLNKKVFYGIVRDVPSVSDMSERRFEIKANGLKKEDDDRYYPNIKTYNIQKINDYGSYVGVFTTEILVYSSYDRLIISGAENTVNNGIWNASGIMIYDFTLKKWGIRIDSTVMVAQSITQGTIKVYPKTLSESSLISDIVKVIWGNNPNIETTTGIVSGGVLNFENTTYSKIMETLNNYLLYQYRIGYNEEGYVFVKKYNDSTPKTFISGFNTYNLDVNEDLDTVKNFIIVTRRGTDLNNTFGASIGYTATDSTSVSKYGTKKLDIEVGNYFSDIACQKLAESALLAYKKPRYKAKVKQLPYEWLDIDNCKVISSADYENEIEVDYADLTITQHVPMVFTDYGYYVLYKANTTQAIGTKLMTIKFGSHIYTQNSKFIIYGLSNIYGSYGSQCYVLLSGNASNKDNLPNFETSTTLEDQGSMFFQNVPSSQNNNTIEIYSNQNNTQASIYIKKVIIYKASNNVKHYEFPIASTKYSITEKGSFVDVEFDTEVNSLDRYLANVKSSRESNSNYIK